MADTILSECSTRFVRKPKQLNNNDSATATRPKRSKTVVDEEQTLNIYNALEEDLNSSAESATGAFISSTSFARQSSKSEVRKRSKNNVSQSSSVNVGHVLINNVDGSKRPTVNVDRRPTVGGSESSTVEVEKSSTFDVEKSSTNNVAESSTVNLDLFDHLFEPIICQICGQNFTDKVTTLKPFFIYWRLDTKPARVFCFVQLDLREAGTNKYCIEGTEMRQLGFKVRRLLFLNRY
jgi:hypothetical protein